MRWRLSETKRTLSFVCYWWRLGICFLMDRTTWSILQPKSRRGGQAFPSALDSASFPHSIWLSDVSCLLITVDECSWLPWYLYTNSTHIIYVCMYSMYIYVCITVCKKTAPSCRQFLQSLSWPKEKERRGMTGQWHACANLNAINGLKYAGTQNGHYHNICNSQPRKTHTNNSKTTMKLLYHAPLLKRST